MNLSTFFVSVLIILQYIEHILILKNVDEIWSILDLSHCKSALSQLSLRRSLLHSLVEGGYKYAIVLIFLGSGASLLHSLHLKLRVIIPWLMVTISQLPVFNSSWSWSYGSWIYNYLCNQCLPPLTLWVRILLRRGELDTKVWLTAGRWFSPGTQISSTNKTDHHNITEILLKVALNTINPHHSTRSVFLHVFWLSWVI